MSTPRLLLIALPLAAACGGPSTPPIYDVCDVGEVALGAFGRTCIYQGLAVPDLEVKPCGADVMLNGNSTRLTFDRVGNLLDAERNTYTYNEDGQLASATFVDDERTDKIELTYLEGRPSGAKVTRDDRVVDVAYGYDVDGRRISEKASSSGVVHHYDENSGLLTHTTRDDDDTDVLRRNYAKDGTLESEQHLRGDEIILTREFDYDMYERLRKVTDEEDVIGEILRSVRDYRYDDNGRVVLEDLNNDTDGKIERRMTFLYQCN